jgi:hypothetical protein
VAANPAPGAERVALERRDEWFEELHPVDRWLTTAITSPLLGRYGYRITPDPASRELA